MQGVPNFTTKFAMCLRGVDMVGRQLLDEEQTSYEDLLLLDDCEEGYRLNTYKILAVMRALRDRFAEPDFFMNVDDDSFVALPKLAKVLEVVMQHRDWQYAYIGMLDNQDRLDWWFNNTESPNYDPWENWPYAIYPPNMAGGPGYLLGKLLLRRALAEFMLEPVSVNGDRAIGIAVYKANQSGSPVMYVNISADDGETEEWPFNGTWGEYPFVSQHKLSCESIECLLRLQDTADPSARVDECYVKTLRLKEMLP